MPGNSEPMILEPCEIGMPPQFPEWRSGQGEAIDRVVDAFNAFRFVVMCAPTGAGKSATAMGVALLMGWRVLYVTASKSLQDQVKNDFECVGMVDIRGRANYQCRLGAGVTCEDGMHMRCGYASGDQCPYRYAYNEALKSQFVTTNYSYQMLVYLFGDGLGHFDLVVFDEAHESDTTVCEVMGQTFHERNIYYLLRASCPREGEDASVETWKDWARSLKARAVEKLEVLREDIRLMVGGVPERVAREVRQLAELVTALQIVGEAEGPWAVQNVLGYGGSKAYRLEPLWARQYAPKVLFRDFPRILFVSATVRAKTMELLGVGPTEYDFQEYPYLFPIRRSPVYFIPTAFVQFDSTPEEMAALQQRIDEIMDARMDRNGIIHAVSYKLRDWIHGNSLYNHLMLTHDRNSESTRQALKQFEALQFTPPNVLLSPSIATGTDFKHRRAEYQIIPKMPFVIVKGNRIMEARCRKRSGGDPTYPDYLMAQTLAQAIGRIMRAEDDRGESFILDNNFDWVRRKLARYFPGWVRPLIQVSRTVPKPPPPLSLERGDR